MNRNNYGSKEVETVEVKTIAQTDEREKAKLKAIQKIKRCIEEGADFSELKDVFNGVDVQQDQLVGGCQCIDCYQYRQECDSFD